MTLQELYTKYNYTPPTYGFEFAANIEVIFNDLIKRGLKEEVHLTREEFNVFFMAEKDEILVSMLLDGTKKMNEYFNNGVDFRGLKVKII